MSATDLPRLDSIPSASGGIARLLWARLQERGVSSAGLLPKAGLTVDQINNRRTRLPVKSQVKFLELGAEALPDDLLGFHLARDFDLREIGLLYYVLASSETVADALHKAERYSGIVNEGISLKCRADRETAVVFNYIGAGRQRDRQQIEFWITTMVRLNRQHADRRLVPTRIRVVHHRAKAVPELRSFFGCEIEFGSDVDEVVFPGDVKFLPVASADHHLNDLLVTYCEEALAHHGSNRTSLRARAENTIAKLLPHGKARAEEVARRLGMSHRTLARRLSSDGLTFTGILDRLKVDLARNYLKHGDLPISQIAWLLGYREASTFTHAFRRWTGMSPRQARSQAGGAGSAANEKRPGQTAGNRR